MTWTDLIYISILAFFAFKLYASGKKNGNLEQENVNLRESFRWNQKLIQKIQELEKNDKVKSFLNKVDEAMLKPNSATFNQLYNEIFDLHEPTNPNSESVENPKIPKA